MGMLSSEGQPSHLETVSERTYEDSRALDESQASEMSFSQMLVDDLKQMLAKKKIDAKPPQ